MIRWIYNRLFHGLVIESTDSYLLEARAKSLSALDAVVDIKFELTLLESRLKELERETRHVRTNKATGGIRRFEKNSHNNGATI